MTYNLTNLTNSDNIWGLFNYANQSTNSLLVGLFIIAIFFILLMALRQYTFIKAAFASSFISFILSMLLTYSKLLNFVYPLTFFILTACIAFYVYVVDN